MSEGGMVVLMDYKEDGITPYFWFIKEGILEEKYVCVSIFFPHAYMYVIAYSA